MVKVRGHSGTRYPSSEELMHDDAQGIDIRGRARRSAILENLGGDVPGGDRVRSGYTTVRSKRQPKVTQKRFQLLGYHDACGLDVPMEKLVLVSLSKSLGNPLYDSDGLDRIYRAPCD